jgi:hypothetical protein
MRLDPDLKVGVTTFAKLNGITFGELVRRALIFYIENHKP